MIAEKFLTLLSNLEIYIFSFKDNFEYFNNEPLGFEIKNENKFDCTSLESKTFYSLLRQMDAITFGGQGMAMEGWMYFDCSAMPGSIVGFGIDQEHLPVELLDKLNIPKLYKGIIPISMFIAIPMLGNNWFGHNLSSLKSILGDKYSGLGLLTKAVGIEVMKITSMYGATQWGSAAIHIHTQLADLQLITSKTPVHTHEHSFCYKSLYTTESIVEALSGRPKEAMKSSKFKIKDSDRKKQFYIQQQIESGVEYTITGRPIHENGDVYYRIV